MGFRTRPPGVVDGAIGSGGLDLPHACSRAQQLARHPFKFTVTGPHMLAKTLVDKHYRNLPDLAFAIADALAEQVEHCEADVIQLDEANLPGNPDEWRWAADAMNRVLDAVPAGTGRAVHLCFGNYGGQTIQRGTWAALLAFLDSLHADHVVLELAHRPADDPDALKDLSPRIGVGYDLFGTGKTALKFRWGRYLAFGSNDAPYTSTNPAATLVAAVTNRQWTDSNNNRVVDCDLLNMSAQNTRQPAATSARP
jgi:5-methyltetrahydropteroyltriglutamate--homocysteine methyltransferase